MTITVNSYFCGAGLMDVGLMQAVAMMALSSQTGAPYMAEIPRDRYNASPRVFEGSGSHSSRSKYRPHQGAKECARRRNQYPWGLN